MPVVDHKAALKIGEKAEFNPISDTNIPTQYFSFANYEMLDNRRQEPKLLTGTQKLLIKNKTFDNKHLTQQ